MLHNSISQNPELIKAIDKNLVYLQDRFDKLKLLLREQNNSENLLEACNAFYYIFDFVPIMISIVKVPFVLRAVMNDDDEIFEDEWRISYNTKRLDLVEQERFNLKGEGLFYAAMGVNNPDTDPLLACCLETCKQLAHPLNPPLIQDFTIGRWELKSDLYLTNFCFDEAHLIGNQGLKEATESYLYDLKIHLSEKAYAFIYSFLTYFSELSGSDMDNNECYYILTALFMAVRTYYFETYKMLVPGIIYPSARTEKKGLNIVLLPQAVDHFLDLKSWRCIVGY
jgi:hypothetical protein